MSEIQPPTRDPVTRSYFLPYQEAWLKDTSRMKIAEKSRRIGWTYVQAYEDVRDAARAEDSMDVWFTSADESAAREYIRYCEMWAQVFNLAARDLGEVVLNKDDDVKALVIEFANGKRIHGLSSNPKAFRSKGGKVVIDEFAFHEQADELWKAAAPAVTWGYPIRVFSSHNGKDTRFYRMCEEAQQPGSRWSHHKVTIEDAIRDGLIEKIRGLDRPATQDEVNDFLQECREISGDEETYAQEYMCDPMDGKTAFIPFAHIVLCESPLCPQPLVVNGKRLEEIPSELYEPDWSFEPTPSGLYFLGVDIGRRKDLTVMWLLEFVGDLYWTRFILVLEAMQFRKQYRHLERFLRFTRRACIDQNGIGMQLAEDALEDFGEHRVEPITFSNASKAAIATTLKPEFEDARLRIPKNAQIRRAIHKIKRLPLPGGGTRFDGERDKDGHADEFWALGLARYAADHVRGPIEAKVVQKRRFSDWKGAW
jgi:phage FluMu gp28-like protein